MRKGRVCALGAEQKVRAGGRILLDTASPKPGAGANPEPRITEQ